MTKKIVRITTVPMALRYLLEGQMKFMKENGFTVLMISADGKEREEVIANEGCPHIIVPMTRAITPILDLICLFQLFRIFKREMPDIVHTHTPKAGLLGMLAAKFSGIKVRIHTVAGMPLMTERGFRFYLLKLIEKITYGAANHIWPNSYSLRDYILDKKLASKKKLNVIAKGSSNGIDLNRFNSNNLNEGILSEIKCSIHYNPENYYLLFMGRLVLDKGLVELVEIFNKLHHVRSELKLLLIGRYENELDPLPDSTMKLIKANQSIINVEWTHHGEYYMHISNCFVFPSYREGFPNALLQSAAMNLPIIASRIPGNVDIITDKVTGLLFEMGNDEELLTAIEFALMNPAEMAKMSHCLNRIVSEDFNQQTVWKALQNEYLKMTTNSAIISHMH